MVRPTQIQFDIGVAGMQELQANLNKQILRIEDGTYKGLLEVAKFIQRDMETTPPLTPVKTNNLRSSWGTEPIVGGKHGKFVGINMGYMGVDYAWEVHELVEPVKHWSRPKSGAHWFIAALQRNLWTIVQLIAFHAKPSKF